VPWDFLIAILAAGGAAAVLRRVRARRGYEPASGRA
jgi:hypothetical protein